MAKDIPAQQCFKSHNSSHCARAKAHVIKDFVLNVHSKIESE